MSNQPKNKRNVKSLEKQSPTLAANSHEKKKDFLTHDEVLRLAHASYSSMRNPIRNRLIIMLSYMHGLRVSELINIKIDDIDFKNARLWVSRLKGGLSTEHPIERKTTFKDLKRLVNHRANNSSDYLFQNESGSPMTRQGIFYIVKTAAGIAGIKNVHPHTLRHSCGYYLANKGYDLRLIQDYLGHRDPKHTALYTRTASNRFKNLF